ncbi:PREDICTED: universal stress protein A-like protein isoform X3 [Lupinus angustifolius]|uniref:universal stress protein A-like protein isoform X3 n=1 Tax=Lupinus angustifolius TaxID=3871 RepID=UPI00092FC467|nr:PREDICTED: universal stress protein A-like protein isoform X3 [Lupinus angustifolius]
MEVRQSVMEETGGDSNYLGAGALERRMNMKVMVAIDESEGSFYALKWALDKLFSNKVTGSENEGKVFLVHVQHKVHNYVYPVPVGPVFYPASVVADSVQKAQEQISASIISRALQICKDNLVKAESIILKGDPREMICQAVEQIQVDLLIIGSRGLGMLKRTFLGSVSDYCAHHAKTPILIVKPPEEHSKKH